MLLLLDLSAAFDTVNHEILLNRLKCVFGIDDVALKWFRSYLSNRTQSVVIDDARSDPMPLLTGVPQGSVLGPLLFSLYMKPLGELISRHKINYHFYADDSQLYLSFSNDQAQNALSSMNDCIADIREWMSRNFLLLNDSKTEFLIFSSNKSYPSEFPFSSITVGDAVVNIQPHARNLGVLLDSNLSMEKHILNICKNAYYYIRSISRIRKFLYLADTEKLMH
jgi:hypothetical protein